MRNEADSRTLLRARSGVQDFLTRMQDLLDTLNTEGVEATTALRERIAVGIGTVRDELDDLQDTAVASVETLDDLVQENPWVALAAGAVLGVAFGYAASRLIPESTYESASRAFSRGSSRMKRHYRPYARKARRFIRDHKPF